MKLKTQPTVEGPMGLRMPEKTARQIETLSKGLPHDFTYRRMAKAIPSADFKLDPDSRTDISTITTNAKDRDGEVVLPAGGKWDNYNKVVTFCHQYDQLPVGSNWWMKSTPDSIIAKTHYPTKPPDWEGPWMPSAILHLMQQEVPTCTGKSIGFLPMQIRPATSQELSTHPTWKGAPIIAQWWGFEYAVAVVPANAQSEMLAVSKCLAAGAYDEQTAEIIRKAMGAYAPIVKALEPPRRQVIVIPGPPRPIPRSKAMSADAPVTPTPGPAKYQALDFKPPKDVAKAHADGIERHEAGETKGHATPEMVAMAKHLAMGGDSSPGFCKKCKAFHDAAPNHVAAKPGTPAFALAQMHGGAAGKAFYDGMCKSMDLADAAPGPGPDVAVDENGGTPSPAAAPMTKKDMGGSENDSGAGGDAVGLSMPMCKSCKTNADVKAVMDEDGKHDMDDETGDPKYECKMCGKAFSQPTDIGKDGNTTPPSELAPEGDGDEDDLPGGKDDGDSDKSKIVKAVEMTDAESTALAERIIELQTDEIIEKAMQRVEDALILAAGGV